MTEQTQKTPVLFTVRSAMEEAARREVATGRKAPVTLIRDRFLKALEECTQ